MSSRTAGWICCVCGLATSSPSAGWAREPTPVPDRPTLNVIAGGINTRGSDMYADFAATRNLGDVYKIEIVNETAGEPNRRPGFGNFVSDWPGLANYLGDWDDAEAGVKRIRVSSPSDPRLAPFIKAIAKQKHATVMIDMDLFMFGNEKWETQTDNLASIASNIAHERLKAEPRSENTILTHSAGTWGLSKVEELEGAAHEALFQNKYAASPQTKDLSRNVVVLLAAGDLGSTSGGITEAMKSDFIGNDAASRNIAYWTQTGHVVVQKSSVAFEATPFQICLHQLVSRQGNLATELAAHASTHKLGVRDGLVKVYLPEATPSKPGEPPSPLVRTRVLEIANVSTGSVLKALEGRAGPAVDSNDRRHTKFDDFKDEIARAQPPRGGGIALRATAQLAVSPTDVSGASWDEHARRIILTTSGMKSWRLPVMDVEIARAAYRCVFGGNPVDPEFSIGIDPLGGAPEPTAPGQQPAYYIGPIRNSVLGLVLLKADVALGKLAYGGSKENAERGLDKVVGYHSLPEMYPAKYADQPQQRYHLAVGDRVVIQSLPSRLVDEGNGELVYFQTPELAVRFGRTTPVERAYADIFGTYYFEILERVPELRDLVECARVVGVLKWLRENHVPLSGSSLTTTASREVVTPRQVGLMTPPKLEDLSPKPPLVIYGESGPTGIIHLSGGVTRIRYERGHLEEIVRADGRTLTVHTDDLGGAIAIDVEGIGASAFRRENDSYITLLDGVNVASRDGKIQLGTASTTRSARISDPRELIDPVARNFIGGTLPQSELDKSRILYWGFFASVVVIVVIGLFTRSRRRNIVKQ